MAAWHWLSRVEDRVRGVVHMNHNTGSFADRAQGRVEETSKMLGVPCFTRKLDRTVEQGRSPEDWWREQRYRWFEEVSATNENLPIVVAHTLDDCAEEYVMCVMVRGFSGTIPYKRGPCVRPFRLWKKCDIREYASNANLAWDEDPANDQVLKYKRAKIRHDILPAVRVLNPGIYKFIERAVREQDAYDAY
jgi:tRNA(Ile)-lysidine synthetase-like protein